MIISNLNGGLGNQLFQRAAGLEIAKEFSLNYYDGIQTLNTYPKWTYKLGLMISNPIKNIYNNIPIYHEPSFNYNKIIIPDFEGSVLSGYFQSWKYSRKIINELRTDFSNTINFYPEIKKIYQTLFERKSVFFHVRRGDYLEKNASIFHGTVENIDILDALRKLIKNEEIDLICGFGDDLETINNIIFSLDVKIDTINVSGYKFGDIVDLLLMSACKHSVIANSTFSWWGSHLSLRRGGITSYPSKWFATDELDTSDLFPDHWTPYN